MKLIVCKEKVSILYKIYYSYIKSFKFVQNIKRIPNIQNVYNTLCSTLFRGAQIPTV